MLGGARRGWNHIRDATVGRRTMAEGAWGMRWEDHIAIDPAVRGGQPVIRGTRVPVDVIGGAFAAGERTEDLCHAYALCEEQIRACLAFAAAEIAEGQVPCGSSLTSAFPDS